MQYSTLKSARRGWNAARSFARALLEWPLWALLLLLLAGIGLVSARPLSYGIDIGYEEGWGSDRPLIDSWNTGEPEHATADQLSYRWTTDNSRVALPGLGAQPLVATLHQLPASANPAVENGALHVAGADMAVSQPLATGRQLHVLVPPDATAQGSLRILAPPFTPPNDPRVLGAPIARIDLVSLGSAVRMPSPSLLWPLPLVAIAWATARRCCVGRRTASAAGLVLVVLLLAALAGDPLRWALAGIPMLTGALWGLIFAAAALVLIERYAPRVGLTLSPWFARSLALLIFWVMLLRYGGRLYPESMVGDLGFHVNRQNEVLLGLIHLTSLHRGIAFPYPSAPYILLAPLRLLPLDPYALVEWSDAAFGAIGLLPFAYLALRGLRDERAALLATVSYACLAPTTMALWWSFLTHIFSQEVVVLLIAVLIGSWQRLSTLRGMALLLAVLCLLFFGHFGLYINVSLLLGGLLPLLWWRFRNTVQRGSVVGLALAFGLAQVLALGLFYSAYADLIVDKLSAFSQGGMGAVQGGRAAIATSALLRSLWRDGLVAHYALVGVPLALLGGLLLWRRQPEQPITWLFWGCVAVALFQAAIPFVTSSTISTRWLSFSAWLVAVGVGLVLDQLWRRGRFGQGLAVATLFWIGGNTLWLWVKALGFRIRPPEPF